MQRLLDEAAIARQLHLYTAAQDTLDLTLLRTLCASEIKLNVKGHLYGQPATTISPDQLADTTLQTIGGFTATQHMLANHIFSWKDDKKVHVTVYVVAYSCIQDKEGGEVQSVTARAFWHVDLEKGEKEWLICGFKLQRDVPLDHPELYAKASERFQQGLGRASKGS